MAGGIGRFANRKVTAKDNDNSLKQPNNDIGEEFETNNIQQSNDMFSSFGERPRTGDSSTLESFNIPFQDIDNLQQNENENDFNNYEVIENISNPEEFCNILQPIEEQLDFGRGNPELRINQESDDNILETLNKDTTLSTLNIFKNRKNKALLSNSTSVDKNLDVLSKTSPSLNVTNQPKSAEKLAGEFHEHPEQSNGPTNITESKIFHNTSNHNLSSTINLDKEEPQLLLPTVRMASALETEEILNDLVIHENQITMSHSSKDVEKQKASGSRETSSKNKHAEEDIVSNDENSREGNFSSSKPNTAEGDIIPSIINEKGNGEFIATSIIHTDDDTMEHELQNSKNESKNKKYSTSRNSVDDDNVEHEFELQNSRNESNNKRDYTSSNKVDNDTMENEFELLNSRNELKNKTDSISNNNLDNDTMEHEFEVQNSKNESKNKKDSTSRNNLVNDNVEHEFELQNSRNESKNKGDSISRNDIDNDTMEHEFELLSSRNELKNKTDSISRNNVDDDNVEHKFEVQNSKHEATNKKGSTSRNNLVNNNVEHEFELQNSKIESKNKGDSISRNDIDNDTMEHEFELLSSRNELKNKTDSISRNNVDDDNVEHKFEVQNSKNESTNKVNSISRNNVDNDTIEDEFELQNSRNESKNKKDYFSRNNSDNDMIEQEFGLQNSKNESKNKRNYISCNDSANDTIEHEFEQQNSKNESKSKKNWLSSNNSVNDMIEHKFELQNSKTESKNKKNDLSSNNLKYCNLFTSSTSHKDEVAVMSSTCLRQCEIIQKPNNNPVVADKPDNFVEKVTVPVFITPGKSLKSTTSNKSIHDVNTFTLPPSFLPKDSKHSKVVAQHVLANTLGKVNTSLTLKQGESRNSISLCDDKNEDLKHNFESYPIVTPDVVNTAKRLHTSNHSTERQADILCNENLLLTHQNDSKKGTSKLENISPFTQHQKFCKNQQLYDNISRNSNGDEDIDKNKNDSVSMSKLDSNKFNLHGTEMISASRSKTSSMQPSINQTSFDVPGTFNDENFDDILSIFCAELVECNDIRQRGDTELLDSHVELCITESIALRYHSDFNDLLEEVNKVNAEIKNLA